MPFLREHYGNPSSGHALGHACREAMEDARSKVATLLGADRDEIVFTSGGTESNNLAICGTMMQGVPGVAGHLIISAIEHPAVVEPARYLERLGFDLTIVPCDSRGVVSPAKVAAAIRPDTRLVSIMHANNETGVIQPLSEISEICREHNVLLHTDAAQTVGKIGTLVEELGVDLLSVAGHKLYAPKGIGALYVRRGVRLEPVLHGAGHEMGLRPGTENVPYIVGLGQACMLAFRSLEESARRLETLRDRLYTQLSQAIGGRLKVNGQQAARLPNTLSVNFPDVAAAEMIAAAARTVRFDRIGLPQRHGGNVPHARCDGPGSGRSAGNDAVERGLVYLGRRNRPGGQPAAGGLGEPGAVRALSPTLSPNLPGSKQQEEIR